MEKLNLYEISPRGEYMVTTLNSSPRSSPAAGVLGMFNRVSSRAPSSLLFSLFVFILFTPMQKRLPLLDGESRAKSHPKKSSHNSVNGWVGLRIPGTSLRVDSVVCLGFLLMHP